MKMLFQSICIQVISLYENAISINMYSTYSIYENTISIQTIDQTARGRRLCLAGRTCSLVGINVPRLNILSWFKIRVLTTSLKSS